MVWKWLYEQTLTETLYFTNPEIYLACKTLLTYPVLYCKANFSSRKRLPGREMDGRLSSLSVHKSIIVRKLVSSEFPGKEDKGSRARTSA